MRQAVENTLDRAGKLLVDEGVAQGLPRDQAEMLFGGAREKLTADPTNAMGFPLGPRLAQPLLGAVGPAEVAEAAFTQALDKAVAQGHVARDGGESSSGTGDVRETTHQRGQFRLRLRSRPGDWSAAAADASRSLFFAVAAEPRLTLRLGAGGEFGDEDDDDEEGETVLVKQTAKAFRARIVRAGKEVLKLEAGSFRDCCRTHPDAVRRELAPLLKRIGIRLPPMPDDAAVKTEVVARLRKAAGATRWSRRGCCRIDRCPRPRDRGTPLRSAAVARAGPDLRFFTIVGGPLRTAAGRRRMSRDERPTTSGRSIASTAPGTAARSRSRSRDYTCAGFADRRRPESRWRRASFPAAEKRGRGRCSLFSGARSRRRDPGDRRSETAATVGNFRGINAFGGTQRNIKKRKRREDALLHRKPLRIPLGSRLCRRPSHESAPAPWCRRGAGNHRPSRAARSRLAMSMSIAAPRAVAVARQRFHDQEILDGHDRHAACSDNEPCRTADRLTLEPRHADGKIDANAGRAMT
jgi:hypothetical protein